MILAEAAEWRPHQIATIVGAGAEISVKDQLAVFPDLNPVLRAFGEGGAMPGVFLRSVGARFSLAGPAGHFELGPAQREPRVYQPELDPVAAAKGEFMVRDQD
jgi:hypothetical protein